MNVLDAIMTCITVGNYTTEEHQPLSQLVRTACYGSWNSQSPFVQLGLHTIRQAYSRLGMGVK
jgi:hypothetical protein